jgi:hypothetical protein
VIEWSGLEYCLDLLILAARNRSTQQKIPHQLEGKLVFLKDSLKSQPRLAAYAEAITTLTDEVCALKESRHDYVHGAIINITEETRPLAVTLHRMLQPPKKMRRHPVQVTSRQINSAADEACRLADRLLDMAEMVNRTPKLS